jgi:hypothetical protein
VADSLHTGRPGGKPNALTGAIEGCDTRVDRLAHDLDRLCGLDAVYDLDRVAIGFRRADPLAAAGLIGGFDARRTGQLRDRAEVVLLARGPRKANEMNCGSPLR